MEGDDWKGALMELLLWSERCVAKDPSPAVVLLLLLLHRREGRRNQEGHHEAMMGLMGCDEGKGIL